MIGSGSISLGSGSPLEGSVSWVFDGSGSLGVELLPHAAPKTTMNAMTVFIARIIRHLRQPMRSVATTMSS